MRLAEKAAIVTGSTRGIGRAIAEQLAAEGAKVAICGRKLADAEAVVHAIEQAGGVAAPYQCDVTSSGDVQRLVANVLKDFGRIDILVNNAGITRDTLLLRMSEEDWDLVMDVNVKGMYRFAKAVLRPMLKQRAGRIVNVASVVGLSGNAGQANYAAAKAAVVGFTKSLAREVAPRGITVNALAPGYIETDMTEALTSEQKTSLLATIPLGEIGRPGDIAHAVAFLASDEARYITGHTLVVDGGLVMH